MEKMLQILPHISSPWEAWSRNSFDFHIGFAQKMYEDEEEDDSKWVRAMFNDAGNAQINSHLIMREFFRLVDKEEPEAKTLRSDTEALVKLGRQTILDTAVEKAHLIIDELTEQWIAKLPALEARGQAYSQAHAFGYGAFEHR